MLTDPEKMRVGLEQFASNPMLAGMAESMPELKAVLDNPALMEESIAQAQKLFSGMAEGGLGGLGGTGPGTGRPCCGVEGLRAGVEADAPLHYNTLHPCP